MKKREVINLILAFAVVVLIIGILITAFAKENSSASDAGKVIVIVTFLITITCEVILRVTDRRRK